MLTKLATSPISAMGPLPLYHPVLVPGTHENEAFGESTSRLIRPDHLVLAVYLLGVTNPTSWSRNKDKCIYHEKEKRKLTIGNRAEEIKYGGPWPWKKKIIEPDDECERLGKAIRSPHFKKLPWYSRYLAYFMYYVSCRGN